MENLYSSNDALGPVSHSKLRPKFKGLWIANGGFDQEKGNKVIEQGIADMVSYGNLAVANDDLPLKF